MRELPPSGSICSGIRRSARNSGSEAIEIFEDVAEGRRPLDILCIEGSIMMGPDGTGL